jgi:hypothetical protein
MGVKSLEITDFLCPGIEEGGNRKTADVMRRKTVTVSSGGDFGKPLAQSSPVQEHKHSNSDTLQRSFSLQDFIVKGTRSSKKKSSGAQEELLPPSCAKERKSHKRINPTRLGTGKSSGLYLIAVVAITTEQSVPSRSSSTHQFYF